MSNKFTYNESLRFERLSDTFSRNFRITNLYATYLERFPNVITEEMIDLLCGDGSLDKADAIPALLGEIFGLDTEQSAEDRALMRDYIIPSVRILNSKKYTENPYYKNIKLDNVSNGEWEIRRECYEPYRAVICDDMIIGSDFLEIPPLGFFEERFEFPAVLEGGNEWMTLTPVDLDTSDEAIAAAHGKVITFGLGLGYYAYMVSEKNEVESITVVERSERVIELFERYILPQFPHREKVRIVMADAFEYAEHIMPSEGYDVAFVDTWRDASDGAPMYCRMKPLERLSRGTKFIYWIERFIISHLRAKRFADMRELYRRGELDVSFDELLRSLSNVAPD